MIYDNLVKNEAIVNDVPQILEDVQRYEQFFRVEEADVVVDIGAHTGEFVKRHMNNVQRIYAVEPDPLFVKELRKIKAENLSIYDFGISSQNGTTFIKSDGNANAIGTGDVSIQSRTFLNFLQSDGIEKIDFLKIDCEGAEYDIFTPENVKWIKENCKKVAGEFHIHNDRHRILLPYVLMLLEEAGISVVLTAVNGVTLSKNQVLSKLNFYTEILFYFRTDENIYENQLISNPQINYNFVNGCFVEITDWPEKDYLVQFINKDNGEILHQAVIGTNSWAKCYFQYYINWQIVISSDGDVVKIINQDLDGLRVLVNMDSKSLGDTLAWMPYAEEFRKKHNCKVILSTFLNDLFKETYPEIEFVEPGTVVEGIMGQYNIGWYYKDNSIDLYRNPADPKRQTMQKTASDILGLEFREIKPLLKLPEVEKKDTVTIGFHSTSQCKYWNNSSGWSDVVDYINSIGYTPLLLSNEGDGYMGNKHPEGIVQLPSGDLSTLVKELVSSKLYVGIGTGLTWLAWACNVPTILISGFSEKYTEMKESKDVIRIGTPEGKGISTGSFNKYRLDPSNWSWYRPKELVGTARQFECSKSIESSTVIQAIKSLLNFKT